MSLPISDIKPSIRFAAVVRRVLSSVGEGGRKERKRRKIGVRNRHISQLRNTRPGSGSLATLASYYLQQKQTLQLNFYLLKELLTNSLAFSSIFSPSLSKIL
mmetsp:Transcript_17482/g.37826  ORF Transcript_17482/g.37826 Transcript_17482/m.37826 type:complete len:102 (+) Transcript_17482:2485-2790(+)